MRQVSRLKLAAAVVALAAALAAVPSAPAGAAALNLTGIWQAAYHCAVGPCAGQVHAGTLNLKQAEGSSAIGGSLSVAGELEGTVAGTLTGSTLSLEGVGTNGYTAKGIETVSADGLSFNGSYEDNHGTSGTFTAVREAPASPTLKASAIEVLCNLELASSQFTCSAEVGGTGASAPTGTVAFSATTGAFTPLPKCSLTTTPGSPTVADCTVTYVPPAGGIPTGTVAPVTATYSGDSVYAPSTAFAGAGAGISATVASAAGSGESVTTAVTCPGGAKSCPIEAVLLVAEEGNAVVARAKRRTVTLGKLSTTLKAGEKRKLTVRLNHAGKRLLASHHRLSVLLRVSSGGVVVKTAKVKIKARHG